MRQFLLTTAGVFFGMAVFTVFFLVVTPIVLAAILFSSAQSERGPAGRGAIVLELDLRQQMTDQASGAPFFLASGPAMLDVVRALAAAETDARVRGVFIRANESGLQPGQAQEIRDAVAALRRAGKFVVAHSQGFSSTSVTPYLAVSGADEIWLQQTAGFSAAGLTSETMFLGGLIEKYDAQAQILQIAEYKTGANSYTEAGYTEAHRESLTDLLTSLYDQAVEMAAADRGLTQDEIRALLEAAPYSAENAARAGLVDRVGHVADAREAALSRADDGRIVKLADYMRITQPAWSSGPSIALIGGQGEITTGETWSQDNLFSGGTIMGSDTLAQAFLDAAEDDSVRAIVFRVDTPGGSIVASEQIRDAARRARDAGKPIVVSMGPTAASGGYYVATPADAIVAQPGTLTGSIGIYGGKIVVDGALDLIGLNIEPLSVGGPFAGAYTAQQPFTEAQLEQVRIMLEDGYADFTGHVAAGRGLTAQQVEELARGRVWTGRQALDLGLVDQLGGLREAIETAKSLAGIDAGANVTLTPYPRQPAFAEQFRRLFGVSAESVQALGALARIMGAPEVRAAMEAASGRADPAQARADLPAIR